METCPHCNGSFKVEEPERDCASYDIDCPLCSRYFKVENLPRIVWKRDSLSGTWYTSLVHRYTAIDNVNVRRFEYYD